MPGDMKAPVSPREFLDRALSVRSLNLGEILIERNFTLRHVQDEMVNDLEVFTDVCAARKIAAYDAAGNYRSLKTAPNLRRGWLLQTGSLENLELALDFFYPSALALCFSWVKGSLDPTPLRETLDRQSGMYRVTRILTDQQAVELISRCCNSETGCLRKILWEISPGKPLDFFPVPKRSLAVEASREIPLICREVCHLVIAAARPIAKANLPKVDAMAIESSHNYV